MNLATHDLITFQLTINFDNITVIFILQIGNKIFQTFVIEAAIMIAC